MGLHIPKSSDLSTAKSETVEVVYSEEAIAVANNSKYGLSGGIYSADAGTAFAMARQIRTGTVQINGGPRTPHPHMPFGGFKASGLGREWGDIGYYEFTELKSIGFHAG